MPTITRFAPSPTGSLHIGGVRTALFNWLYARKTGGEMVLRIEDTDRQRSTPEAMEAILHSMKWLGLSWDAGPFFQSRRLPRYGEVIHQLLEQGDAYHCLCSRQRLEEVRNAQRKNAQKPRYDGHCRELNRTPGKNENTVVRFKNPSRGSVVFDDVVRGRVEIANSEMDDLIIARMDGTPTYNLSVVVDDIDMGITHVVRGDDHTNNTPRQINIFHALQAGLPVFAHVPLILGEDGQRLSKRHGAVGALDYRDMGILPEALLNYLVRLGWSHGDQEIFDLDEMIELFDVTAINKSPAAFNMEKLLWINQQYMVRANPVRLTREIVRRLHQRGIEVCAGAEISEAVAVMRERAQTLEQMAEKTACLYQDIREYDPQAVKKYIRPDSAKLLRQIHREFAAIDNWNEENINQAMRSVLVRADIKLASLAQPIRIALSGSAATPPIDVTVKLVGRQRTLERIEKAVKFIEKTVC